MISRTSTEPRPPKEERTILVEKYERLASAPLEDSCHYKGLRIHAVEGLHEYLLEKAKKHFQKNGFILDLACGTGAFSLRLREVGFDVAACDVVTNNFRLHGSVSFVKADLNGCFSDLFEKPFDGIVACEIIEHLENPRSFLRECKKLLRPGGAMILTTPNIDNPVSKASFLRNGTYMWYLDADYVNEGHIMPISQWLLKKCISESGLQLTWLGTYGDPFVYTRNWWKIRLFARFIQLFSKADKNLDGEILVMVVRRNDAD